jgi:hypothetical protein
MKKLKRPLDFKPKKPEPVILKIQRINRNGVIKIKFNQKLIRPPFLDNVESAENSSDQPKQDSLKGRQMIPVSALDV